MTTNDEHHDALYDAIREAISDYTMRFGKGVRVDVIQAALGSVTAETFGHIKHKVDRDHSLESLTTLLRDAVADIGREIADPFIMHPAAKGKH